jgi:hypothetical protein
VLIKIGVEETPALSFAGLRYALAFLCLDPIVIISRRAGQLRDLPAAT